MNGAFSCAGILQQRPWASVVPTREFLGGDSQLLMALAALSFMFRSFLNKKTLQNPTVYNLCETLFSFELFGTLLLGIWDHIIQTHFSHKFCRLAKVVTKTNALKW